MFKLSGQPRRQYKKELAALKCSIRHFWQYNDGDATEERFNEITEQIRVMEMELLEVI